MRHVPVGMIIRSVDSRRSMLLLNVRGLLAPGELSVSVPTLKFAASLLQTRFAKPPPTFCRLTLMALPWALKPASTPATWAAVNCSLPPAPTVRRDVLPRLPHTAGNGHGAFRGRGMPSESSARRMPPSIWVAPV